MAKFSQVYAALEDGRCAELEEWDGKIAIKLFDDRRQEGVRSDEISLKRIYIINLPPGISNVIIFWNPTQREIMSNKWIIT
jgi:hypothetical protein